MSINYQISDGFSLLSRITAEFKELARGTQGYGDSQARKLHKLRRHAEIFGGYTEAYIPENIVRKNNLERYFSHEQSFGRTKYPITS